MEERVKKQESDLGEIGGRGEKVLRRKVMLKNPSTFTEIQAYPKIQKFLQYFIDQLFEDMRSMLKHPLYKKEGGCNFAMFNFICDVISGLSVTIYKPEELFNKILRKKGRPKEYFKELMKKYYPWEEEDITPSKGIDIIWDTRHSLTHRVGIVLPSEEQVKIRKPPRGLRIDEIEKLEDVSKRSDLRTVSKEKDVFAIHVVGFYRGLHKMLKKLFQHESLMKKVNSILANKI